MYKKYIKRILDILISTAILVILSPLYLIIAIIIKVFDRCQIIYYQDRTGKFGKEFRIYKFRTIKNGNNTKIGKFLRMTSLDELPQFYNVLKGDMSIIGPRPWIPEYYENFSEEQRKRVSMRPGIIGLAQVNGRRDIDVLEKIDYDLEYIENANFLLDLKILFKSVMVLISKEDYGRADDYIRKEIQLLKQERIKEEKYEKNI